MISPFVFYVIGSFSELTALQKFYAVDWFQSNVATKSYFFAIFCWILLELYLLNKSSK